MGKPVESDFWREAMSLENTFGEEFNEEKLLVHFARPQRRKMNEESAENGDKNKKKKREKEVSFYVCLYHCARSNFFKPSL